MIRIILSAFLVFGLVIGASVASVIDSPAAYACGDKDGTSKDGSGSSDKGNEA